MARCQLARSKHTGKAILTCSWLENKTSNTLSNTFQKTSCTLLFSTSKGLCDQASNPIVESKPKFLQTISKGTREEIICLLFQPL